MYSSQTLGKFVRPKGQKNEVKTLTKCLKKLSSRKVNYVIKALQTFGMT